MKKLALTILPLFISLIASPVFSKGTHKTPEECKKEFRGDDAKIKGCLKSALQRTVIISADGDEAKINACLDQLRK